MSNTIKRRGESRQSTNRVRPGLEILEHRVVLSTFRVNTTLDTVAVNFKNGKDASGHISLRSAIMAADTKGGSNKIILPSGTFTLTIAPTGADDVTTGDLNITGNLTIKGKNAASTIIDGNNLDRVFQISSGKVSISNLTIQHGRVVGDGGGILNSSGKVNFTSVRVLNNVAIGSSGTIGAIGANSLTGTAGSGGNGTSGTSGEGGGIFNAGGSLSITSSTIASNEAEGGTGGNGGNGGQGNGVSGGGIGGINGGTGLGGNGGAGGAGAPVWAGAFSTRRARR